MPLSPGTCIGIYQIVEMIGVGGMGEVYRARDSRLDRPVAIKTLPPEFAADSDRLARFEREARLLAQLNHPHIASIYGLEPGSPAGLAMELVEGDTLAHRISAGPLPIDEVLLIARQLADALEHAHAKGVIHRDLKPANIKTGSADAGPHVKVLDFGLAKAMLPEDAASAASAVSSPTITSPATLTRAGIVLGTAAYMAPEQARGKVVDQRADIWAFGCVVYEMLSGCRAFEGHEIADVLARVIQTDPDWSKLPVATPGALRSLLQRCLRKDLHRRTHAIADIRIELDDIIAAPAPVAPLPSRRATSLGWAHALAGLLLGAAITAAVLTVGRPPAAATPLLRYGITTPEGWSLFRTAGNGRLNFAISPDGEKLAAVLGRADLTRKIFIRRLRDTAFRELPGTEMADAVFWAPDSNRLGFSVGASVRQTDLSGGGSRTMASLPSFTSASWGPHDEILAATGGNRPLYRWSAAGGTASAVESLPEGVVARIQPRWLPGGKSFLFIDALGGGQFVIKMYRPDGVRELKRFESSGPGSTAIDYQADKLLLISTERSGRTVLVAESFNPSSGELGADSSVIATDLNVTMSASATGTLIYGEGGVIPERFFWLDQRGTARAAAGIQLRAEGGTNFDLSPNERYVVMQQGNQTIQIHDLLRGVTTTVAVQGSDPIWLPNGREIAFAHSASDAPGIYVAAAFGGPARLVFPSKAPVFTEDWAADGRWIAAVYSTSFGLLVPQFADAKPVQVGESSEVIDEIRFSPDSQWIAYNVRRPNLPTEVFLSTVPPSGERWQLSVAGGAQARWRADGRALYFLDLTGKMMLVEVDLVPGRPPVITAPKLMFDAMIQVQPARDQFEVSRDARRFILRRPEEGSMTLLDTLQVIVNWPLLVPASLGSRPN